MQISIEDTKKKFTFSDVTDGDVFLFEKGPDGPSVWIKVPQFEYEGPAFRRRSNAISLGSGKKRLFLNDDWVQPLRQEKIHLTIMEGARL